MSHEVVKVWVTTYALTKGLLLVEGTPTSNGRYVSCRLGRRRYWTTHRVGTEAFLTEEEALADAEKRLARKLVNTKNLLARLRKLKIKVVDLRKGQQDV